MAVAIGVPFGVGYVRIERLIVPGGVSYVGYPRTSWRRSIWPPYRRERQAVRTSRRFPRRLCWGCKPARYAGQDVPSCIVRGLTPERISRSITVELFLQPRHYRADSKPSRAGEKKSGIIFSEEAGIETGVSLYEHSLLDGEGPNFPGDCRLGTTPGEAARDGGTYSIEYTHRQDCRMAMPAPARPRSAAWQLAVDIPRRWRCLDR